jgi:hypothetical protein
LAHPDQVVADDKWMTPAFSTAMGLLAYHKQTRYTSGFTREVGRKKNALVRRLTSIFEDLF